MGWFPCSGDSNKKAKAKKKMKMQKKPIDRISSTSGTWKQVYMYLHMLYEKSLIKGSKQDEIFVYIFFI